ncbi:NAD(P)/FAD-dependent oxidoreductase [Dactylosporangium sp. NPDC005572]|uniref:FAD-dependent oxidoreductase n=1 Tax=Dactylosporangium sp. NPDC005572 TaxID=3156889 RepID=UPI0033B92450
MRVIIIGAGTGGMCLAHGLRRAGVDVVVYERDRTRTSGLHGYRVGIDPHGSRALKACLPPELYRTFVATCARAPEWFAFLDERLRPTLTLRLRPAADDVNDEKSVSRMTLRQVLFTGMEDVIRFDKEFQRYSHTPDGRVTAHFADGTADTADLLVGADGVNSPVRRQRLPHARLEDAGIVAIAAKVPMTPESTALMPPGLFPGIGLILAPRGLACILHWMEFPWSADGRPEPAGNDADLLAAWPGLLFDNTRDYLNWGLSAATGRFPADVMDRHGRDLVDLAIRMTPRWDARLHRLFALTDPSTCFPINIRTSVRVDPWPTDNVTLLGDAIHTMTPGQGVGANTALRDAHHLVQALTSGRPLLEAVAAYERAMLEYGFAAVEASKRQTGGDQLIHKPVIGRLALAGQRAFLRATDRIPALKRRFEAGLYETRGTLEAEDGGEVADRLQDVGGARG